MGDGEEARVVEGILRSNLDVKRRGIDYVASLQKNNGSCRLRAEMREEGSWCWLRILGDSEGHGRQSRYTDIEAPK